MAPETGGMRGTAGRGVGAVLSDRDIREALESGGLIVEPILLPCLVLAAMVSALLPAAVFVSTRSPRGAWWAFPYALYSLVCLAWISPWALLTSHRSGWLTRQRPAPAIEPIEQLPLSSH